MTHLPLKHINDRLAVTVWGAGAFGTALAVTLSHHGLPCCLWGRDRQKTRQMFESLTHEALAGVELPSTLYFADTQGSAAQYADCWIIAVPAAVVVELLTALQKLVTQRTCIILGAKGLHSPSSELLHHALSSIIPTSRIFALSGPSFAQELASGCPTSLVLAGPEQALEETQLLCRMLTGSTMCVTSSQDVTGVLLAGAFKNILAIGAGLIMGTQQGENLRSAFLCQGFEQVACLAQAMGGRTETLQGLAGWGDLCLSAMSAKQSRNQRFGLYMGQGMTRKEALARVGKTVEGLQSLESALRLAKHHKVNLSLIHRLKDVIDGHEQVSSLFSV